jgi:hypothetical protein
MCEILEVKMNNIQKTGLRASEIRALYGVEDSNELRKAKADAAQAETAFEALQKRLIAHGVSADVVRIAAEEAKRKVSPPDTPVTKRAAKADENNPQNVTKGHSKVIATRQEEAGERIPNRAEDSSEDENSSDFG